MIDETATDIREMRTHSSSVVARRAAEALRVITERDFETTEELIQSLERNSRVLRQSNPSHAWLQSSQWDIVDRVSDAEATDPEALAAFLHDVIEDTVAGIERATEEAGATAASQLADGDVILTHDYSTTVLAAIEGHVADNNSLTVYVTEARPRVMGRRMARRVGGIDGVSVTLIVDSACGHYLSDCDHVMTGMDCIVEDTLYNRVGTLPIACAADHHDVPFSVLGAASKVVEGVFSFENEQRDPVEVMREPAPEFTVANPAYDATPLELVDTVVTDEGITEPS